MEPPQFKIIGPDGRESAPFDVTSLLSYARQGYIQPHTMIYDMQQARWMPAAEHPALGGAQPAAAYEGAPSRPTPAAVGPQPPRPAGKTALVVAVVSVCLIVLLAAGYGLVKLGQSVGLSSSESAQTVTAEDGRYAVTVPAGWMRWNAEDRSLREYVDVGTQAGLTLTRVADTRLGGEELGILMGNLNRAVGKIINATPIQTPHALQVNGFPALQQDFSDNDSINKLRYRLTIISTPHGVYQLMDFVPEENQAEGRSTLNGVIASFRPMKGGAQTTVHPPTTPK